MRAKHEKTPADIAYDRAVEACNRIIDELDKELERAAETVTNGIRSWKDVLRRKLP